jgi:hypothetical protein
LERLPTRIAAASEGEHRDALGAHQPVDDLDLRPATITAAALGDQPSSMSPRIDRSRPEVDLVVDAVAAGRSGWGDHAVPPLPGP